MRGGVDQSKICRKKIHRDVIQKEKSRVLDRFILKGVNKEIFEECRKTLVLLLHPIAPHMTEEIWEDIAKDGYASLAAWPTYNNKLLNKESDYKWKLMNNILEDINNIKTVMKKEELKSISLIIADHWKFKFYDSLMSILEETKNQGEIMKKLMQDNDNKKYSKQISKIVSRIVKNVGKYPKFTISSDDEYQFFADIKPLVEKKYHCTVNVMFEKDSKEQKASQSLPGKPAIVII